MSCSIASDSFHGTKKGMRRKTVSKRRAYVMTPSSLIKNIRQIELALQIPADTKKASILLSELRNKIQDSR